MDCDLTLMLLVAPLTKLRNASLSSVSEFCVLVTIPNNHYEIHYLKTHPINQEEREQGKGLSHVMLTARDVPPTLSPSWNTRPN